MDVCLLLVLCAVMERSLRRADPSSRGVLPTMTCVWVWSSENKQSRHLLWVGRRGKDYEQNLFYRKFLYTFYIYIKLLVKHKDLFINNYKMLRHFRKRTELGNWNVGLYLSSVDGRHIDATWHITRQGRTGDIRKQTRLVLKIILIYKNYHKTEAWDSFTLLRSWRML
jgi:hypothetical protein